MPACPACKSNVALSSRFCSSCGSPVGSNDMATLDVVSDGDLPTMDVAGPQRSVSSQGSRGGSSSARPTSAAMATDSAEGRFLPGVLIAGRYRIISLLGRGGMGEVYRADDLTLGQAVALKFLPHEASQNAGLLERFRNEVRISRKVSHPNVCRVYDV